MEKIAALLRKYKKIWFYVPENEKEDFCKEVVALGGTFPGGEAVTADLCGQFMSVTEGRIVSYVSAMAWMAAKEPGNGSAGIHHSFDAVPQMSYEAQKEG